MREHVEAEASQPVIEIKEVKNGVEPPSRRKRATNQTSAASAPRRQGGRAAGASNGRRVSTAPLITLAFLVGFILAVMGYDYITTNNLGAVNGQTISGLDVVLSALTLKGTTEGGMTSFTLLWLFVTTLLLGLGICAGEWSRPFQLGKRDWVIAIILFIILAFAIFSGLVFYHVLLIATQGSSVLEALLTAVALFTVFMLLVVVISALTMLFDEPLPSVWVSRTTNYVVAPVLVILTIVLILSTNIDPIRADMLYKQAASLSADNTTTSIQLFQRALAMQPQQDYYDLFLGRAYLDAAKASRDVAQQTDNLNRAESTLQRALDINPYNTDHSANLARLAQARGALSTDPSVKMDAYKQAAVYFDNATRLSPGTAHLYDQHAQELLEYAQVLDDNKNPDSAAVRDLARQQIQRAMQVDSTFCLTYAVRAQAQTNWRERVTDALKAIEYAPRCGDVFFSEGLGIAVGELARAADESLAAKEGDRFEAIVKSAAQTNPTLEVYTTLANFYSRAGRVTDAITAVDGALTTLANGDPATRKRYEDFRFTLVELQKALDAVNASPNDPELQRAVAQQWLARGQLDFALPAFQKVLALNPDDYSAHRSAALLLISTGQYPATRPHLTFLESHAPPTETALWQNLEKILTNMQSGDTDQAITLLGELAKTADPNDFPLVTALHKLAEQLKGTG